MKFGHSHSFGCIYPVSPYSAQFNEDTWKLFCGCGHLNDLNSNQQKESV